MTRNSKNKNKNKKSMQRDSTRREIAIAKQNQLNELKRENSRDSQTYCFTPHYQAK
jgi:hypothetical protein